MRLKRAVFFLYMAIALLATGIVIWFIFFFSPVKMSPVSVVPPTSTLRPTKTPTPPPTATAQHSPIPTATVVFVEHKIIYQHFGEYYPIVFEAPSTWQLEKLGEWEERAHGEKTGSMCSNYALRKPGYGVLYISPWCGTGEGIAGDCLPGTVIFWEDEYQNEYGRRGAYARYHDKKTDTYVYYDAWIGNLWTSGGGEGVYCMFSQMESSADDFLKAQYYGKVEYLETTIQEIDEIVLSVTTTP